MDDSFEGVNADQLDEKLVGLSLGSNSGDRHFAPGQQIHNYERALSPHTPKHGLGFKVTKRSDTSSDRTQLQDFPNG